MGSFIELNDTLRISREQGFPVELDIKRHLAKPFTMDFVKDQVYTFMNKDGIRVYHQPPVRCFLVEFIDSKWLYWGLCHIQEITHDYVNKTTSGKYKIIYINNPEEMKHAFNLIDRNPETNYFASSK